MTKEEQRRLLAHARDGTETQREAAYRALMTDFLRPAMSVIHRTLSAAGLGAEHAEEAWQQCIFKFFTVGVQSYRGDSSVRTYFVRSALYAAVDVVRTAARHGPLGAEAVAAAEGSCTLDQREEHLVMRIEALRACLSHLSGDHAEAVRLYYIEDFGSCAACAQHLHISGGAFMKRLERARRKLANCVQRRLIERA